MTGVQTCALPIWKNIRRRRNKIVSSAPCKGMDRSLAAEKSSACGSSRIQQVPAPVKAGKCSQQDFERGVGIVSVAGGKSVGPPHAQQHRCSCIQQPVYAMLALS